MNQTVNSHSAALVGLPPRSGRYPAAGTLSVRVEVHRRVGDGPGDLQTQPRAAVPRFCGDLLSAVTGADLFAATINLTPRRLKAGR